MHEVGVFNLGFKDKDEQHLHSKALKAKTRHYAADVSWNSRLEAITFSKGNTDGAVVVGQRWKVVAGKTVTQPFFSYMPDYKPAKLPQTNCVDDSNLHGSLNDVIVSEELVKDSWGKPIPTWFWKAAGYRLAGPTKTRKDAFWVRVLAANTSTWSALAR